MIGNPVLGHYAFGEVEGFLSPIVEDLSRRNNSLVRVGIDTVQSSMDVDTICSSTNVVMVLKTYAPLWAEIVCPASSIYGLAKSEKDEAQEQYWRIAAEVLGFLSRCHIKSPVCPICKCEGLTVSCSFLPQHGVAMIEGTVCQTYYGISNRSLIQNTQISTARCDFAVPKSHLYRTMDFPANEKWKPSVGISVLKNWANFSLGVAHCVLKNEVK